jgi:hypothetical protein
LSEGVWPSRNTPASAGAPRYPSEFRLTSKPQMMQELPGVAAERDTE